MMKLLNKNLFFLIFVFYSISLNAQNIAEVQDDDWVIGNMDAPITMIEYASLSCPHCASFHKNTFPTIKKEYIDTGKVKFVFRDFPLNIPALQASKITRCVGEEFHFKYVSTLFMLQKNWVKPEKFEELIFKIVENGGITKEEFDLCLDNKEIENKILNHQVLANQQLRIKTTPSFVINGELVGANKSIDDFRSILNNLKID